MSNSYVDFIPAALAKTVQHNCDISDARHAGKYSMCTFLLKMREYYRWQQAIPLSEGIPRDAVGSWLVNHEQYWEDLYAQAYKPLQLTEVDIKPFDTNTVNTQIIDNGYVYSAGRGIFSKPHFFLGELLSHTRQDDIDIYISGNELARDLVAPPAMLCGKTIFIRTQSVRRFIWEKIEENRWRRLEHSPIIDSARQHGLDITQTDIPTEVFETLLDDMTALETQSALRHELGEVAAGRQLPDNWSSMLQVISGSQAEFIARAIRDHLADALSTLPWLLNRDNIPALHFYFGNFTGLRKVLFPEALTAYNSFIQTNSYSALEDLCAGADTRWQQEACTLLEQYTPDDEAHTASSIEKHYHNRIHATRA